MSKKEAITAGWIKLRNVEHRYLCYSLGITWALQSRLRLGWSCDRSEEGEKCIQRFGEES